MSFAPSLEYALRFLEPNTALRLFETKSLQEIEIWLKRTEWLLGDLVEDRGPVEDLCFRDHIYSLWLRDHTVELVY